MKSISRISLIAASLAVMAVPARAGLYGVTGVGASGGYLSAGSLGAAGTVGMHAELGRSGTRLLLVPGVMYWDSHQSADINPNVDVTYHLREENRVTPYLGAGVGLHKRSGPLATDESTDLGMNLLGGVRFPGLSSRIFVEGRYTVSDVSQTAVLAGATFTLGP